MNCVFLIAANFVREQRLIALLLAAYAIAATLFFGLAHDTALDDMAFVTKQQIIYAVLFSGFIAVSAIHNERKTRRLLLVLSKSITRAQYIAGLLVGVQAIIWGYLLMIWLGGVWMLHGRASIAQLTIVLGTALVTAVLAASLALFFASFLPPMLAMAAAGSLVLLPVGLARAVNPMWLDALPIYSLVAAIARAPIVGGWHPSWQIVVICVLEAQMFWLLAVLIFSTRDVAVAVE